MILGKRQVSIAAGAVMGAFSPVLAAAGDLQPAIVLIAPVTHGASNAADRARQGLDRALRSLGAAILADQAPAGAGSPQKVRVTARRGSAFDPSRADLAVAVSAQSHVTDGAYTRRLRVSIRADLYATGGNARRTLRTMRERRLPATCRAACTERLAGRMVAEAARGLAPQVLKRARALVPVPARHVRLSGFSEPEIVIIGDYLRAFPGFVRMDRGRVRGDETVIRYTSRLDRARLAAAVKKMLRHMQRSAAVRSASRDIAVVRTPGAEPPASAAREW